MVVVMKKARMRVYYVQGFSRRGDGWTSTRPADCGSAERAVARAAEVRDLYDGVVAATVLGSPEFDAWEDPEILARYGTVPEAA